MALKLTRRRFAGLSVAAAASVWVRPAFGETREAARFVNPLIGASTSQKLGEGKTFPGPTQREPNGDPERAGNIFQSYYVLSRAERRSGYSEEWAKSDWEVELAVVIGKTASYIEPDEALEYVAGYVLHNDYSERALEDLQLSRNIRTFSSRAF
jgi:hypothetical protein